MFFMKKTKKKNTQKFIFCLLSKLRSTPNYLILANVNTYEPIIYPYLIPSECNKRPNAN